MVKRSYKGGGWFTDDSGNFTTLSYAISSALSIIALVGLGVMIYVLIKVFGKKEEPEHSKGHAVAPPISKQPGRINVAEVAQSPSAGQAIIYFSQAEAAGTTCESCTASFDIQMSYSGGMPVPAPSFQTVTTSPANGTVTFDYSVPTQTGGTTGPQPTPPNSVSFSITARSINPETGATGLTTTFSKTIPYIA